MSPTQIIWISLVNNWVMPVIILGIILVAWLRGVKVYEEFIKGAKEGFDVAVMIIPYLVAILCAIAIFRYGGAMEWFQLRLKGLTDLINMDPELLPLAIVRPMSGSGARGVLFDIWINIEANYPNLIGPDTLRGFTASVMQGSTETTFYVLAVYCGVVNIKRTRYTVWACLAADFAGFIAAVIAARWYWIDVLGQSPTP